MELNTCNESYLEATLSWSFNFLLFQLQITSGIKTQKTKQKQKKLPGVIPRSKEIKNFSLKHYSRYFSVATAHLEKGDENSYLIAIIVSVLAAFAIFVTDC